jgi:hypothetical protein
MSDSAIINTAAQPVSGLRCLDLSAQRNARSMISCCSTACTLDEPDDRADMARRGIRLIFNPPVSAGVKFRYPVDEMSSVAALQVWCVPETGPGYARCAPDHVAGVKARPSGRPGSGVALTPARSGASWRGLRGRPCGVANAPCSLARSWRIGWMRTMVPSQTICTDPATMETSTSFPRQARPARYMVPAKDTCPLASTIRVTTIPVVTARGVRRPWRGTADVVSGLRRCTCSATSTSWC